MEKILNQILAELKEIKKTQSAHTETLEQHTHYFGRVFLEFENLGHFARDTQREFVTVDKNFKLIAKEFETVKKKFETVKEEIEMYLES